MQNSVTYVLLLALMDEQSHTESFGEFKELISWVFPQGFCFGRKDRGHHPGGEDSGGCVGGFKDTGVVWASSCTFLMNFFSQFWVQFMIWAYFCLSLQTLGLWEMAWSLEHQSIKLAIE